MERLSDRIRRWTFDIALPFWADRGVDWIDGGFVELFDADGRASADYKRTRVAARQVYVFSHAAILGWSGGLEIARHGYEFLIDKARLPKGGWARRLSRTGQVIDPTQDLYDIAFVLFALGWYTRASGEKEPLHLAHATVDLLDAEFRHPSGGFAHELPMAGWRLQNPHMHLLEASLSLLEADPNDGRFASMADKLRGFFISKLYNKTSRTLPEYFQDDWSLAPGELGRIVEPGHQFEWAWILANHQRLRAADNVAVSAGLFDFAESHGVDVGTQVVFNTVDCDGAPLDRGSRTWPNTERIKGAIALYDLTGRDPTKEIQGSGELLLNRYLDSRGTWIDQFDAGGRPSIASVPTSTFYHVFLAFAEVLRVAPGLKL